MAHEKIKALITFVAVFAIVGGISWALVNAQQLTQQTSQQDQIGPPETMSKLMIHEELRDAALTYIKDNHSKTTLFMNNLAWAGGRLTPGGLFGA